MKTNFLTLIKTRRSSYSIENKLPVEEKEIEKIIENALINYPSLLSSQSARIILLIGEKHLRLWQIVKNMLRRAMPDEPYFKAENKINNSFASGYGTILFFEDTATVKSLENKYPIYKKHFKKWSSESIGMLEFIIWTYLANINVGASLRHYNPLIDNDVKKEFNIPSKWVLISQMPFGAIVGEEKEIEKMNVKDFFIVIK